MAISALVTNWNADDPETSVDVGAGLIAPKYVELRVADEPGLEMVVTLQVVYDATLGRYGVERLEVERAAEGLEITNVALRSLRIQEFVQRGLVGTVTLANGYDDEMPFPIDDVMANNLVKLGPNGPSTLLWIARVYRMAEVLNLPPAKAVQEQFGLKAPTASVWIRRARDRGLLPETGQPSASGLDRDDG